MIDYRSDTVTKPTAGMLQAMTTAEVGDDVFGEDPSILQLESYTAKLFGMESAIFCPSGTMTNQIAIKCHTQPGDEVICDELSHIYQYEGGGIAFNSGCSVRLLKGDRGRITAEMVENSINNPDDVHKAVSTLVSLENTTNRGGGACYDFDSFKQIKAICDKKNLALHLDGARIFNAIIARNENPLAYGQVFTSISICLSKGLGAPVGSVLLGSEIFIKKAKRYRKIFGGGMRQAGFLAAAGLYALQHQTERLKEDHRHIELLAEALRKKDFVYDLLEPETNILIFGVTGRFTPVSLVHQLKNANILAMAISATQVRLVTHLNITREMIDKTILVIQSL